MTTEPTTSCRLFERPRERDRVGVWGFGSVSRDVVLSLVAERLGKEIVFYGRPKGDLPNRAGAWIDDLKANATRRPRLFGTNHVDDMADLDVIFIGVGAPRKPGQSRRDLLEVNTDILARTCVQIRDLYTSCSPADLPILVFMGNPITAVTWVGYKITGFPKENIMGQAGNLDTRRICYAVSQALGLSGNDMRGIVFGEHGDSMVSSPHFFSVGGVPLDVLMKAVGVDPSKVQEIMEDAKKGGTHFVHETGRSASAGPAKAACDMLRCMITGEPEIQPAVAIIEKEYNLLKPEDGLDSMSYGVPAKIGRNGVEEIYELPVDDIREQLDRSAAIVKEDIQGAYQVLREKYAVQ